MEQVPPPDPALQSATGPPLVVLDTNTVLDWLVFGDPSVSAVAEAICAGRLRWIWATRMRDELADVLLRSEFVARRTAVDGDRSAVMACADRWACAIANPPTQPLLRCRDADDQVFIDLAIASGARWLLTRDKALLALARVARHRYGIAVIAAVHWRSDG